MRTNSCPCCGTALLRHARRQGLYWFCPSCHQEMIPLVTTQLSAYMDTQKTRRTLQAAKS